MDLASIFSAFGMCSLFYAAGRYLNELSIYLDNTGRSEILQKVLLILAIACFIFSIPAFAVFYPLQNLLLKRMEGYWIKGELERWR